MTRNTEKQDRGLYRSRRGIIFGVCRGLAEYFDISVTGARIITFIAFLFGGFWPVGVVYIVAALIMKVEPVLPLTSADDAEFYNSYAHSSTMGIQRLKRTFDNLDRRIRRMEDIVTSRESDWERRLNDGERV